MWRVWAPLDGRPVFSFDRWRSAEIIRLAASRTQAGLEWVEPLAAHVALLAASFDPAPDDGEVRRAIARIVARLIPITSEVHVRIESGIGQFRWRSFDLGRALGLLPTERIALNLRTIRDVTETPDVMRARRLARRRAREGERRRTAGAEPQSVREMRARLTKAVATAEGISIPTARKRVKSAEDDGALIVSSVTNVSFERHVTGVLSNMQGRAKEKKVTPAALRMRRKRERDKAEAGAPNAPVAADVLDHSVLADLPSEITSGVVAAISCALDLPVSAVSVDGERGCIAISVHSPSAGKKVAALVGATYSKARRRIEFYPERAAA